MAKPPLQVETLVHDKATRKNIPTAEFESLMRDDEKKPLRIAYERRNKDLDPQLIWRGKDVSDWSDLMVSAPPLYIQEKVHPKILIDDLKRASVGRAQEAAPADLFADFNGLPDLEARTEFYAHDQHWSNRMICGDSLSVMASLAEREGLRGKVQCIYFDPPYGIKFNSNFQWSTTSRDVKDGDKSHVTREPEQVRAFRDTWRDGIHSYLTYLRDRLTVARDLLSEAGSIFVQIGDENVHRVRALMDEVFGDENFVSQITFNKTSAQSSNKMSSISDYVLWYCRAMPSMKFRAALKEKTAGEEGAARYQRSPRRLALGDERLSTTSDLTSQSPGTKYNVEFEGKSYFPKGYWKTERTSFPRLIKSGRIEAMGSILRYVRFFEDYPVFPINNVWTDIGGIQSRADPKVYVVQTASEAIKRCLLMTTDPGDLVLDPTCGSGTTAYVAEQWGRRWIAIDTSRVAVALARSRLMGARYPYYLLADSVQGQRKEGEITRTPPKDTPIHGDIRQGFVYERVPHIMLKDIANNAEIDVIWEKFQEALEPFRERLNAALGKHWEEWEIPRESGEAWDAAATKAFFIARNESASETERDQALAVIAINTRQHFTLKTLPQKPRTPWAHDAEELHAKWWQARIARQKEIDASIAAKSDFEFLYDKPYIDRDRVRVAGPFTVENLSPHRTLAVDWDDELIDEQERAEGRQKPAGEKNDFAAMILENLRAAGVQQAHKEDRISFLSLTGWPGKHICAEGVFLEGETQKRAGIFIGPEFGTVSRPDLVAAAREAGDAGFDALIACAFNYDAHSAEFEKLGRLNVLKARMNPDLHMSADLKTTGAGNLFVIFGEPDIKIEPAGKEASGSDLITVKVFGVDVFKPQTGEVVSENTDGIALWMIDTDYNEESFFVRHAYFLGANDPYKALKTTLKAEIDEEAWESLYSDVSRPFAKPASGRIAVKVINHLGDEVMKVFAV